MTRFESLLEAVSDTLVGIHQSATRRAQSARLRPSDTNEAMINVTGVPRETVIGTPFSDYVIDPEKADRIYPLVLEQRMAAHYPLTMRHRGGTQTEVLYNASVYHDAGGNVLGVFAAVRDLTNGFAKG